QPPRRFVMRSRKPRSLTGHPEAEAKAQNLIRSDTERLLSVTRGLGPQMFATAVIRYMTSSLLTNKQLLVFFVFSDRCDEIHVTNKVPAFTSTRLRYDIRRRVI